MSIHFKELKTKLGLDDKLGFGRYSSDTIEGIIKHDPDYMRWVIDTTDKSFYESVFDLLDRTKPIERRSACFIRDLLGDAVYMEGFDDVPF